MQSVAFAFPIRTGKVETDREALDSCARGARQAAYRASRARHGITRETVWIQETENGDLHIVYVEADDLLAALVGLATSDDAFDRWSREHLRDVLGVDLAQPFSPPQQVLHYRG